MKVALFRYDYSENIGDNIQTLAVRQHVKAVDFYLDRDSLSTYSGEPCVVVMNGWFSHKPQNWPPSPAVTPIFFGFHMTPEAGEAYRAHVAYFKRFAPIGCRDSQTAATLRSWGVDAYTSGCATLTFPTRASNPDDGLDLLVDCSARMFKRSERRRFSQGTHNVADIDRETKDVYAAGLLKFYRERAKTVITSRIHCAMPCAAMGIPVAYVGKTSYRTDVMSIVGMKGFPRPRWRRLRFSEIAFFADDFAEKKAAIKEDLQAKLRSAGVQLAEPRAA